MKLEEALFKLNEEERKKEAERYMEVEGSEIMGNMMILFNIIQEACESLITQEQITNYRKELIEDIQLETISALGDMLGIIKDYM